MSDIKITSRVPGPDGPTEARALLNGEPYLFRRREHGWSATPLSSPTDRFHRISNVFCVGGVPQRCSCAHCVKRGAWCKHLSAVEAILQPDRGAELAQLWQDMGGEA